MSPQKLRLPERQDEKLDLGSLAPVFTDLAVFYIYVHLFESDTKSIERGKTRKQGKDRYEKEISYETRTTIRLGLETERLGLGLGLNTEGLGLGLGRTVVE